MMQSLTTRLAGIGILTLALAAGSLAASGDETPAAAAKDVDHAILDGILSATVDARGWVDYAALRDRHLADLDRYLALLAAVAPDALPSDAARKAFWINAYNAVCIRTLIAAELPAEVPHAAFFGRNIFTEETYRIAGKERSLDEIEHQILRKRFKDNRIHAAIVCGASSCPRLRNEAYVAARLDAQLDEECRSWVRSETDLAGRRKNRLDTAAKTFHASKILSWFQEDFGGSEAGVLEFIRRFASDADREFLEKNRVRVVYLDYGWKLNKKP